MIARLAAVLALAFGLVATAGPLGAAELVTLEGPAHVDGLRLADADGDGLPDVLLLAGRELWGWSGRQDAFPEAAPSYRIPLPPDASYVLVGRAAAPGGSGLLLLGPAGLRHLDPKGGRMHALDAGAGLPGWADSRKAAFIDAVREDGTLLLPLADGFRIVRPGDDGLVLRDVAAPPFQVLEPAGAFLEDSYRVVVGHRVPVFRPAPPDAKAGVAEALWLLAGRRLSILVGEDRFDRDLLRLPPEGRRRLLALDGGEAPYLYVEDTDNRAGAYTLYRLPALRAGETTPRAAELDLGVPATRLRLEGSQIDPTFVDLDGDGRRDFVVTVIPIDARNTARALTGAVTANTMAYLNRGGDEPFPRSPDATVASDVGVAIRFSQAGTIDVRRSFTILADADVDGDGRKDLVIRTAPDRLTIRRGARAGVWEEEGQAIAIPAMGASPNVEGYHADLDGDGTDEIVLLYRAPYEGRDVVRVLKP